MTDLLDTLTIPHAVRERLQTFRDIAAQRHAAVLETSAQMREAITKLQTDRERLRELERGKRDKAQLARQQADIDRSEKVRHELVARVEKLGPIWNAAHRLSEQLERYVRANAPIGIRMYEGGAPQLRNGETALAGIERAARRTRSLRADRQEVLAAPFPSAMAKDFAWRQMQARVEAAKPDVTNLVDRLEPIYFPKNRACLEQQGSSDVFAVDVVGLLAWIFPTELRAAIEREIDATADDAIALSPAQRLEKLKEIDGDILASEREEAAFADLAGLLPPSDIDPRASLGLADVMQAPERN
ncbi:hypothetical protein QA640_17675 [Bradyrhizobium sp. CB82]|uniref:hypothetical protein n=1 Tax=Bradyrhizobium sp. CB82 TaxID=3039159 RepID=UPI0024B20D25|nr:hypothetical protein [Bradyrhizobium sp. CB82]WFU44114.1 hypothetical protein QA640_17675 [Bradyrhizobium sp. CB82]